MSNSQKPETWSRKEALKYYQLPLMDLVDLARSIHLKNFKKNAVQLSTLYNVKTGACTEDCAYCSQSRHNKTELKKESLVSLDKTLAKAMDAKKNGATRFCMGAAWRSPKPEQLEKMIEMIKGVKSLGLETCATLGMLTPTQAEKLSDAGLDYYNHNLDTSKDYYPKIITTRTYQDRLDTLENVRKSGMKVCCGGILGLGEALEDRIDLLVTLANLNPQPESVPINQLVQVPGTPLEHVKPIPELDYVKTIALARIMMPKSYVRLSAGRENLSESGQTLCFMAGANSVFLGPKLLTTNNPSLQSDNKLMSNLGLEPQHHE